MTSSDSSSSCIFSSENTTYRLLKVVGKGSFGVVAKCLDLNTNEIVAVKVHKTRKSEKHNIHKELEMLQAIKVLDPDQYNIVRFMENFKTYGFFCLSFEMLDKSLWDLMKEQSGAPLLLNDIRNVTKQLLVALDGLKSIGIMHTDLKLDNIMLVNHHDQPFKVKLIDFGLAMRECEAEVGTIIQNCAYRAPEVSLGLPLTTAVDMWGLGCIISYFFFGRRIFPGKCNYNNMRAITSLLGCVEEYKLTKGMYSHLYFTSGQEGQSILRSPEDYEAVSGKISERSHSLCDDFHTLDEAVLSQPGCEDALELSDRMAFLDFLKCCLTVDADQRISPRRALTHCFITNTKMDQMLDGICRDSASEAPSDRSVGSSAIEPPGPSNPLFIDAIKPDGLPSENEEGGATPAKTGKDVAAASDSDEKNVSQEREEANTNQEVIRHLCNKINELQHNYDEVKRLLGVQEARAKALYEELHLIKENQNKEKEQNEEEKDLEEPIVEAAPELLQMNRSQSLDVSEQPVPMKTKKRLSWWKRVKNFFTGGRSHHQSDER